jgi:hypothetical protein
MSIQVSLTPFPLQQYQGMQSAIPCKPVPYADFSVSIGKGQAEAIPIDCPAFPSLKPLSLSKGQAGGFAKGILRHILGWPQAKGRRRAKNKL